MAQESQVQLDKEMIDQLREQGRKNFFFFARVILGFEDFSGEIHKPLCNDMQNDKNGRMVIILPRNWFKSTMGAIAYPLWRAVNDANIRCLIVQNSMTNARKKLQSIKQIVENNELLRALYPEILPKSRSVWTGESLTLSRDGSFPEGTFEAAGTGTSITSRHYDLIIEDDTVSPEIDDMTGASQQPTQLDIEKAIGFHRLTTPLLVHPDKSKIIVIGTRWCVDDLLGWIMENQPRYKLLSRSARENGEIVWDRYGEETLKEIEQAVGPFMFSTLYMNEPLSNIDTMFKRDWIQYFNSTLDHTSLEFCTSVDLASGDSSIADADYTVVITTATNSKTGDVFIIHYSRGRFNPGEQVDEIFNHVFAYRPLEVKVEAISYQRTLVYWLKKRQEKLREYFYINPVKGLKGNKEERIRGLQPYFANRKIFMRPEMSELERELLSFPNGKHDDIIDALTLQIEFWYKVMQFKQQEKEIQNKKNDFSGASMIDELLGRSKKIYQYPYDTMNPYVVNERAS